MNIDDVIKSLKQSLESKYGKVVEIDIPRFKDDLVNLYGENLSSVKSTLNMLEKILLTETTLSDYAKLYNVSYSSIQKNTRRYVTLTEKGNKKYIGQYELLHSKRMNENYGSKTEYLVQKNEKLREKLMEDSYKYNKEISSIIYKILKEYYNIP